MKIDPFNYILGRVRRQQRPRHPGEHRGTRHERLGLLRKESEDFGRISPVQDHARHEFSREMFEHACSADVVFTAIEGLKGDAPGVDGVTPDALAAYAVYERCCAAAQLPAFKRPAFGETLFPTMDSSELSLVALACTASERSRKGAALPWMPTGQSHRATFVEPKVMSAAPTRETRDRLAQLQGDPDAFLAVTAQERDARAALVEELRALDIHLKVHRSELRLGGLKVEPKLMARVGIDPEALGELWDVVSAALDRETLLLTRTGLWLWDFSPSGWIDGDGEGPPKPPERNKHLRWETARWIGGMMAKTNEDGRGFKPRRLRPVPIPKADGGTRTLSIPTVVDRVAEKSAVIVLEPMFEGIFLSCSVGCRPSRDRFDVFADLAQHYPRAPGKFALFADVKRAFDNVSHDALLAVLRRYVGNRTLRVFLERIVRRPGFESGVGLAQGGPASPLLLNALLHPALDEPLLKLLPPGLTYHRYLDDIAVFGFGDEAEGQRLIGVVQELLEPVGLELHTIPPKTEIVNLAHAAVERGHRVVEDGEPAAEIDRYLGIGLRGGADGQLVFFLPAMWRESVRRMFLDAERTITRKGYAGKDGAHVHIQNAAASWLHAFGPAWSPTLREAVPGEVAAIARSVAVHVDALDLDELVDAWQAAHGAFMRRCREEP